MNKDLIGELLDQLETGSHDVPAQPSDSDMIPWRDRIDAIDRILILLLNQRAVYAARIGAIKKHLGLPVYTPSREEEVLRNVIESNPGPLPDSAVRRLFERIIDETRALERHLYAEGNDQ